jgi:hypothetical protein
MDTHRAECTCCPSGNAGYFLAARVRYSYFMRCVLGFDGSGMKTDCDQRVREVAPKARIGVLPVVVAEVAARGAVACLGSSVRHAGS